MKRRARLIGVVVLVATLLVVGVALARPGGGQSYSGNNSSSSSSSSSSDGGDGGGAILELLLWLCVEHPAIGIPLTLAFIIFIIWKKRSVSGQNDWSAGVSTYTAPVAPYVPPPPRPKKLDAIRGIDPQFSRVVFEDFFYSLYAEVHHARGAGQLNKLSAYLAPQAAVSLQQMTRGPVENVVIGAMRYVEVAASPASGARVVLELESNYMEGGQGNYVRERWTLARGANAKSRTPDRTRQLGCPNCGAPQDSLFSGTCKHCGKVVNDGSFDWVVQGVSVMERQHRPPMLTSDVEEQGTDLRTIRDPELPQAIAVLRAKDPQFDVSQFNARVALIFQQFQIGWSNRDLTKMRPFMSDALFTVQQYWIDAYLKQHLRNITDGARITNIELARAVTDAYYDSLTVRLYATSLDYTVNVDNGKLMSGSQSIQRRYSEYWTLIRGTNRKGPTRTDLACSNCGAPLDINMVGVCKYCKVKVTSGDFDWVLSRIEQDESYTG